MNSYLVPLIKNEMQNAIKTTIQISASSIQLTDSANTISDFVWWWIGFISAIGCMRYQAIPINWQDWIFAILAGFLGPLTTIVCLVALWVTR